MTQFYTFLSSMLITAHCLHSYVGWRREMACGNVRSLSQVIM